MKRILRSIILVMLFGGMLLMTGCKKDKEESNQIRVAYFPNITHAQALIMKDQKSLEEKVGADCTVQWVSFNAGPAEVEAIFAGEIDLGYIGPVPAINANVKSDGEVHIIANACNAGAVLIKSKDADISSVKDLEGKKVAVPQLGNTQHLCLLNLLKENGLSTKSEGGNVEVIAVANADLQSALDQGEIDAALVPEPWGSILEEKCGAQVVLDYDEVFRQGDYPSAVVVVNGDFYQNHKDLVEKFLEAHMEATVFINDNQEEAAEIINQQINAETGKTLGADLVLRAFQRISITDQVSEEAIADFGKIGVEQGFISKLPSEDMIDTEIIDKNE